MIFHQLKSHMVGMSKEEYGENGDEIVVPAVEEICKSFGTIAIIYITISLKAYSLFRKILLLFYKYSGENYELEWYTGSGVWKM